MVCKITLWGECAALPRLHESTALSPHATNAHKLTHILLHLRSCLCSMHIQYKYVVRNKDGSVVRWQEGANVSLDLPGGNAAELALDVEDSWNKSKQVRKGANAGCCFDCELQGLAVCLW